MDLAGLLEEHGDHLLRLCTLYLGAVSYTHLTLPTNSLV